MGHLARMQTWPTFTFSPRKNMNKLIEKLKNLALSQTKFHEEFFVD